jgi:hypothetical protein
MRFYNKIVVQWDDQTQSYKTLEADAFEYEGAVALCKGDSTAQASEQVQLQNQQQQLQFSQQLMNVFQQQYGQQQQVLQYLQGKMTPIIDAGGTGYGDQALASMRTSATDNLSNQYQNAQKALQAHEDTSGGRDLPSGVNAQLDASLFSSEAADNAGAQNQITQANENLKQQNYWNAVNEYNGIGASFNPQSYASGSSTASGAASSAGSSLASLSQANTAAKKTGFWNTLAGGLGQGLGAGLGAGLSGGFGSALSTLGSGNFGW